MLHIPILRRGKPYKSLEVVEIRHHRTRKPFVEVSQANPGLIRRDLVQQASARAALEARTCHELIEICKTAAEYFSTATLPLGDARQSPDDYIEQVSATTGLPHVMVRRNMQKIRSVLANMEQVLSGLTRGLDLRVLDEGYATVSGRTLSFVPRAHGLGVVLPSNSPGVHTLWLPAVPMKIPLVLKPGSAEPWTPYRAIAALVAAGCPGEAFGYYPTDHAGAAEILRHCGRGMLFGDSATTKPWQGDPRVEIHGPGFSKVVIGEDRIHEWERYLDVIGTSIMNNGGRSCINASGVWVPSHGAEIAEALADRFAGIVPRAAEDDRSELAPFPDPETGIRISGVIDQALAEPGARDVTAERRGTSRLVTWQGSTYLLPTVIHCRDAEHPLANREFLFPFASVVEVNQRDIPEQLGPSLVVTAITEDRALIERLLRSPLVDRLNLGPTPTVTISWDQPHEGNLFDHLYSRRAIQESA